MAPKRKRANTRNAHKVEEDAPEVGETAADLPQEDASVQDADGGDSIPAALQGRTSRMEQMAEIAQRCCPHWSFN